MNANEQTMHRFYTAFSQLDYATMQNCYHEDAVFSDPAFGLLNGDEVRAMWEMLCKRAKDFKLQFSNVVSEDEYGTCSWRAEYVFSKTGRKVENYIKAYMKFENGKIIEHSDGFKLSRWAAQALGFKGWFFGGFGFFQRKVQKTSRKALKDFMEQKNR